MQSSLSARSGTALCDGFAAVPHLRFGGWNADRQLYPKGSVYETSFAYPDVSSRYASLLAFFTPFSQMSDSAFASHDALPGIHDDHGWHGGDAQVICSHQNILLVSLCVCVPRISATATSMQVPGPRELTSSWFLTARRYALAVCSVCLRGG